MHEDQPTHLPATAGSTPTTPDTPAPAPAPAPAPTEPAPQTWCDWHGGYTDTGRLIIAVEQGSGPGYHRYACASCRAKHQLSLRNEAASA